MRLFIMVLFLVMHLSLAQTSIPQNCDEPNELFYDPKGNGCKCSSNSGCNTNIRASGGTTVTTPPTCKTNCCQGPYGVDDGCGACTGGTIDGCVSCIKGYYISSSGVALHCIQCPTGKTVPASIVGNGNTGFLGVANCKTIAGGTCFQSSECSSNSCKTGSCCKKKDAGCDDCDTAAGLCTSCSYGYILQSDGECSDAGKTCSANSECSSGACRGTDFNYANTRCCSTDSKNMPGCTKCDSSGACILCGVNYRLMTSDNTRYARLGDESGVCRQIEGFSCTTGMDCTSNSCKNSNCCGFGNGAFSDVCEACKSGTGDSFLDGSCTKCKEEDKYKLLITGGTGSGGIQQCRLKTGQTCEVLNAGLDGQDKQCFSENCAEKNKQCCPSSYDGNGCAQCDDDTQCTKCSENFYLSLLSESKNECKGCATGKTSPAGSTSPDSCVCSLINCNECQGTGTDQKCSKCHDDYLLSNEKCEVSKVAAKTARDKATADKAAADKVAADKVAADKVAADKVAADNKADSTDSTSDSSDNVGNNSEGSSDGGAGAIIGAIVGVLVVGGLAVGGFLWYRSKQNQDDNLNHNGGKNEKGATGKVSTEMAPISTNPSQISINVHENDEENVVLPLLHQILKDLYLTSWLNKLILYGIHTTEILLSEVSDEDLKAVGMRTVQRNRLLTRIHQLKGEAVTDIQETEEEQRVNAEPTRKNWKRRFSVASNLEFYENVKTGKVQTSAPTAFGGEDLTTEDNETELLSLENQLAASNLSHLTVDITKDFQGDLSMITADWMDDHCGRLQKLRLQSLIAKVSGNLFYTGSTAGNSWWMHATTHAYQYFAPSGSAILCVPVPDGYFDDNKDADDADADANVQQKQELTRGKKTWNRAKSKMKTMAALQRVKKLQQQNL